MTCSPRTVATQFAVNGARFPFSSAASLIGVLSGHDRTQAQGHGEPAGRANRRVIQAVNLYLVAC